MAVGFRLASLGSCSRGGSSYVIKHSSGGQLLVDCGLGLRRTERALEALGIAPQSLDGVLVTHEHRDHVRSLYLKRPFPQRYELPVYATRGTWGVLEQGMGPLANRLCRVIPRGQTFMLGGLCVYAFATTHDVAEPVGFVISDGTQRLGVATDLGCFTAEGAQALEGCDYLVLESNHDVELLEGSARPAFLKRRIRGRHGHLSNEQAGQVLRSIVRESTRLVVLAHLSLECNTPERALTTVGAYLQKTSFGGQLMAAPRMESSGWLVTPERAQL